MRRDPLRTSAAPLHIEEPGPWSEPDAELELDIPRLVFDRTLWRPLATVVLVVVVGIGVFRVVRFGRAEVDRASRELVRGGFGQN